MQSLPVPGRRLSGPGPVRLVVWLVTFCVFAITPWAGLHAQEAVPKQEAVPAQKAVPPQEAVPSQETGETAEEQLERAQGLSRTVMSPFCPGRTLDSCPSPNATRWREDIREMVAQGMSNEQIRQALAQRTEHDLTGAPSTALDPVLPVIVAVLALLLLVLLLRALVSRKAPPVEQRKPKPAAEKTGSAVSPAAVSPAAVSPAAGSDTAVVPPPAGSAGERKLDQRLDQELAELDD